MSTFFLSFVMADWIERQNCAVRCDESLMLIPGACYGVRLIRLHPSIVCFIYWAGGRKPHQKLDGSVLHAWCMLHYFHRCNPHQPMLGTHLRRSVLFVIVRSVSSIGGGRLALLTTQRTCTKGGKYGWSGYHPPVYCQPCQPVLPTQPLYM